MPNQYTATTSVICTCLTCGDTFSRKRSEVARRGGEFCSSTCYHQSPLTPEILKRRLLMRATIGSTAECWPWTGVVQGGGYGVISITRNGRRKAHLAHRVAYEIFIGPIPPDKPHICHSCDRPSCINPDHLFAGTHTDNMRDKAAKGRGRGGCAGQRPYSSTARGSKIGTSKLNDAKVAAIRLALANGSNQKTLAAQYGVTRSAISGIHLRKVWNHVL